jgi:hypothetical protein
LVLGVRTRREMEEQTTMPSTPTLGWRLKMVMELFFGENKKT